MLLCSPSPGHLGCLSFTTVLRPSMIKLYGFPYHTTPMLQLHDVSRKGTIFSTEAFSCPQYFRARTCVQLRMFAVFLEARGPGAFQNLLRIFKHWIWNHVYYIFIILFHFVSFCFEDSEHNRAMYSCFWLTWSPRQPRLSRTWVAANLGQGHPQRAIDDFQRCFLINAWLYDFKLHLFWTNMLTFDLNLSILQFYDSGKNVTQFFRCRYWVGRNRLPLILHFAKPLSGNAGLGCSSFNGSRTKGLVKWVQKWMEGLCAHTGI